jgi:hypothetical protein
MYVVEVDIDELDGKEIEKLKLSHTSMMACSNRGRTHFEGFINIANILLNYKFHLQSLNYNKIRKINGRCKPTY